MPVRTLAPRLQEHPVPDKMNLNIRERGYFGRERPYFPSPELVAAANAALAVGAPLLLTGDPGCGKTDFAWVVARSLCDQNLTPDEEPLRCHVRSDSRARDFLYRYDPIRRFGDMQHGFGDAKERAQDAGNYLDLMPLGKALVSPVRRVVLIDEIDKAPRDLPNDLLWELDQGDLEIPELPEGDDVPSNRKPWKLKGLPGEQGVEVPIRRTIKRDGAWPKPFVLITSNAERHLPDAFLRRCVFHRITNPNIDRLDRILESWFGADFGKAGKDTFLGQLGRLFHALRDNRDLAKKPSTAELLMWVKALRDAFTDSERRDNQAILEQLNNAQTRGETVAWSRLPALGCLIKLEQDLDLLAGAP